MKISNLLVFSMLTFAALNFITSINGLETKDQILAEIQSTAENIRKACPQEASLGKCNTFKIGVDNAETLPDICDSMDQYIVCQDKNCINRSTTFTEILTDAMVIPYCGPMKYFPFVPEAVSLANQLAELVKNCNLKNGENCEANYNDLFTSRTKDQVYRAVKYYIQCLETKCLRQSADFRNNITAIKNTPMLEVRALAGDIDINCEIELFDLACESSRKAVENANGATDICSALKTYAVCKDMACFKKSTQLIGFLKDVTTLDSCRQVVDMNPESAITKIVSDVNVMMTQCRFEDDKICKWTAEYKDTNILTTLSRSAVCHALGTCANCLGVLCLYPSFSLRQNMIDATRNPLCDDCSLLHVSWIVVLIALIADFVNLHI